MIKTRYFVPLALALSTIVSSLSATPTGLFWSPCQTKIRDPGQGNIDVDNYFSVPKKGGSNSFFPPDFGFTVGLCNIHDVKAEVGVDYLGGTRYPVFFNGKFGMEENKLFSSAPSWSFGIFAAGTRAHGPGRTNQNVLNVNLGKSFAQLMGGTIFVGAYTGNHALGIKRHGTMVGYLCGFCPEK
ncbi:MAG TPA: hypothetical protein VN457_04330, partial [Chlamydiales bacterium]|nr:hypothetical protein [Chlamydiales bacterium]